MTTERFPGLDEQTARAVRLQQAHVVASHLVDRSGWTGAQWVADARRLFGDLHGSVRDLLNGHVIHMLKEIDALNAKVAEQERWRRIAVQIARYGGSYYGLATAERDLLEDEVKAAIAADRDTDFERTLDAATGLEDR